MAYGFSQEKVGWLNETSGQWVLPRDSGGRCRLDIAFWTT
jgi:hypothetical protein